MKIKITKGWFELNKRSFGLLLFTLGIIMLFIQQTKSVAPILVGFGIGVTLSGLKDEI